MSSKILPFEQPIHDLQTQLEQLQAKAAQENVNLSEEIEGMNRKIAETRRTIYENLTNWQRVQLARHIERPYMLDYVEQAFDDFLELHGDRHIGDDEAMPAGFAKIGPHRCVLIGHQKGRDTKENLRRNFGSAHPEGYRKALRIMQMADKFGLPIVSLIDTPGAFPGIGAEERNIAEAIAFNLREMMLFKVPIVACILGEGGSGGALGIAVADRVLMMENAYYSVISPEGCAAILWKHRKHAPEAADALKLTAPDLKRMGVIDHVIAEPEGGAHVDHAKAAATLRRVLMRELKALKDQPSGVLLEARYQKFRQFGGHGG